MRPVVGVIPLFDEEKDSIWMLPGYMEGVRMAGGIPIILPLKAEADEIEQAAGLCSGFLFTGGHDVEPALYHEPKSEKCGAANPDRDLLEQRIFRHALDADKPIFGICRGIQMINVLCGGTLYQDLSTEYRGIKKVEHHMEPPYDVPCHQVEIVGGTPLEKLFNKSTISVNSYHHQAVKVLGKDLKPMAVSEDGLVEAVYMPGKRFVWAVQWHPEFIYKKDADACKLFQAFAGACADGVRGG